MTPRPVDAPTPRALPAECDVVVVGSGAGGLSTAVTAAHLGLRVLVLEKASHLGGTTAWSGGWMFIPHNPLAVAAGLTEPTHQPLRYLGHTVGPAALGERMQAFLAHGAGMVRFFQTHTALRFVDGNAIPDFHGRLPGAATGGRSVCAAPFDASTLGEHLHRLRPPHPAMSPLGLSIGGDLRQFLRCARVFAPPGQAAGARPWGALWYVMRRVLRHATEQWRYGMATWRMAGNALAAALVRSALDKGVHLATGHSVHCLLHEAGRVHGVQVMDAQGQPHAVIARRAVVLACGGYPHDVARQARWLAPRHGQHHHSAAPAGNVGDGLRLAQAVGASMDATTGEPGAWAPVSLVPAQLVRDDPVRWPVVEKPVAMSAAESDRPPVAPINMADAAIWAYPHLLERGKPGLIAVDEMGRRFVSEAVDYHSFMCALFAHCAEHLPGRPVQAWLVCDHRFQRCYGLGHSRPRPFGTRAHRRSGYLLRAATPEGLAQACGINAQGLMDTLTAYNGPARNRLDPAHQRGGTPYERMQGDAEHLGPNPCVAPIEHAPFYAVRIVPGSLGTFAGIATDAQARALDEHGQAIPGLYAVGNDAASVMDGRYPSGGITLGPAMTFGYIASHHLAGHPIA